MRLGIFAVAGAVLLGAAPSAVGEEVSEVSAGSLTARVAEDPWSVDFVDEDGASVLAEHPDTGPLPAGTLGFRAAGVWRHATEVISSSRDGDAFVAELETTDPLRSMEVRLEPDAEGVIRLEAKVLGPTADVGALGIGFKAREDERYLGFGERSNAVDQRGNVVENYVGEGPYPEEERPFVAGVVPFWGYQPRDDATYYPVPWLLSTAGYGVLIDNFETSYFRLASDGLTRGPAQPDAWTLEVTKAPPNQPQAVDAPAPEKLSLRVFAGPEPADVLRRFTEVTGRQPPATAPWYFGPWIQAGAKRANELRAADAPVSLSQTYTRYLPCGRHTKDRDAEQERTRKLHAAGVAVTTYLNPMICRSYDPRYGEAAKDGGLTRDRFGDPYVYRYPTSLFFASQGDFDYLEVSQFDFKTEAGRDVFTDVLGEAVEDGYDGWMQDYGEYTPLDSRSADGEPATVVHNRYPVDYHCAADEFSREQSKPLGRYIRSGWTGVAPCAQIVWGGDPTTAWGFDGLESAITNGITMGLSGVSVWGSDIGGLFANGLNSLDEELKIRWIAFGAVSGVMRDQAGQFAVPDSPDKARPQIWDEEVLPHWRRYAKLRTQLYPYLAAADAEYQGSGMPIMRHLALAYPDDPTAAAQEDEFLFGPDLLAAPVYEPDTEERKVYLPDGEWVDLWRSVGYDTESGGLVLGEASLLEGGGEATLPAPLEEIPLLARAGATIPLLPADVHTLADYGDSTPAVSLNERSDRLELLAFPRGESSSAFYDGEQLTSREGDRAWTLEVDGQRERTYELSASLATLEDPFEPCAVTLDGEPLDEAGWSYDGDVQTLSASFSAEDGVLEARRCGGSGGKGRDGRGKERCGGNGKGRAIGCGALGARAR